MDGKLSVLDRATRARLLLHQLDTEDLAAVCATAMRMAEATQHLRGSAHQLPLPILQRKWIWEPLIVGIEPRIVGDE